MTDTKHTPTPWVITAHRGTIELRPAKDPRNLRGLIAKLEFGNIGADARFIMDACNAHDALVAALRDCHEVMDALASELTNGEVIPDNEMNARAEQLAEYAMKARAALALADKP